LLADDAEADHAGAGVDLADRVGGHEPPAAHEARADRERVGDVGLRAVHRRFHAADHAAAHVRHQEPLDASKIELDRTHR
jgi:hypothetical protein